jgi:hypothetical protein
MLRELDANQLWVAEMPSKVFGVEFGARSTLARLPDGGLWVHSPIRLSSELRQEVDKLGPVHALVAPNKMHFGYLKHWIKAYPEAIVFVSPDFLHDIGVDPVILSDAAEMLWQGVLKHHILHGSSLVQEADFLHIHSKTLILTDLVFNIPVSKLPLTQKLAAGVVGVPDGFAPSRTFKMTAGDKAALKISIERLLEWDFQRIVVAHGDIVENDGAAVLRQAFDWVLAHH